MLLANSASNLVKSHLLHSVNIGYVWGVSVRRKRGETLNFTLYSYILLVFNQEFTTFVEYNFTHWSVFDRKLAKRNGLLSFYSINKYNFKCSE